MIDSAVNTEWTEKGRKFPNIKRTKEDYKSTELIVWALCTIFANDAVMFFAIIVVKLAFDKF